MAKEVRFGPPFGSLRIRASFNLHTWVETISGGRQLTACQAVPFEDDICYYAATCPACQWVHLRASFREQFRTKATSRFVHRA